MAKSNPSGIPMMITGEMAARLLDSGLDQLAINKMTPQQAHDHLRQNNEDDKHVNEKMVARARHRSPNYPFINLEKAIDRARQIYDADRRHDVAVRVASEKRWEYKPGSSQGDQTVAALRAYGLVEVSGAGDKRMVRISDRAYRILANAQDATDRIKDAALSPAIHAELWDKYGTEGLPSDDTIRNYLLFERENGRFNEDVVDSFIARFKDTISFAKLDSSDKVRAAVLGGLNDEETHEGDNKVPMIQAPVQPPSKQNPPPPPAGGHKDFPLYLSNSKRAVLYIPDTITTKDYELLKRQIENHLAVIEATSISDEKPS
jgi:hypothetical protein